LFNTPIDDIKIDDVEQFLQSGVREGTILEFKEQFPSKLEKNISSMANTFGGMILIGVEETSIGAGVLPIKGIPLTDGLRERVIQIGLDAIFPPLIPQVRVVEFKSDVSLAAPDKAVVVIRVHESDKGYAVDQRTAIYVRADNVSDRMRKATVEEWEWFRQKRQKSVDVKSRAIQQAQQHAQQFLMRLRHRFQRSTSEPHGKFVIWTVPTFPRLPIATPQQLHKETPKLVRQLQRAPWSFPFGVAHPIFEGIYWAHEDSSNYYYTEIHQQGLIYSEFEFWWDKDDQRRTFIPSAAAVLLRSAAEYGKSLYHDRGYFGLFDLGARLVGIRDRYTDSRFVPGPRVMDEAIEMVAECGVSDSEDVRLVKCKDILRAIYWAFGQDVTNDKLDADLKIN
jgi:hypothetical protein